MPDCYFPIYLHYSLSIRIVFNKIRALLGGRMWFVIVGGAPLSKETHEFIRTCLGLTIVQGYRDG